MMIMSGVEKEQMSCVDCGVKNCNKMDKTFPDFCITTNMDEEVLNEALACYEEPENNRITVAALYTAEGYYSKLLK